MGKKRIQFKSWFYNYIWIFLICIILACVAFRIFMVFFNDQIHVTMSLVSEQLKAFYDSELEKQKLCIYNAINSSSMTELPKSIQNKNAQTRTEKIREAVETLNHAFANVDSVSDCIIISERSEACISFAGYMPKKVAYEHYFQSQYPDYHEWMEEVFRFEGVSKYIRLGSAGEERMVLLYKVERKEGCTVGVMFLDVSTLGRKNSIMDKSQQLFCIVSSEGEKLFANSDIDIEYVQKHKDAITVNGVDYYIASMESSDGALNYITMLPIGQYQMKFRLGVEIAAVSGIVCLILCVTAAFYLTNKEYKPIDRILKKIGTEYTREEKELFFIEKEIGKVIEQNFLISSRLNQTGIKLRESLLANLIKFRCEMSLQELYEKSGIDLRSGNCILILFEVCQYGVFQRNDTETINFAISNVFSELLDGLANCYYLYIEKQYICIVNSDEHDVSDSIYENLEFLMSFTEDNFAMALKCAISKKGDVYSLPELYVQAQELVKLENVGWRILIYDEIIDYISEEFSGGGSRGEGKPALQMNKTESIYAYISEHYCDPMVNMNFIASEFSITINHLSRSFKERFGIKPSEYLLTCRVKKAEQLLKSTGLSVAEIGEQCGFLNTGMFIRSFKKYYGASPGVYRDMKF